MGRFTRAGAMVGALGLAASLALTGCGGDQKKEAEFVGGTGGFARYRGGDPGAVRRARRRRRWRTALTVSPADGAKSRPVSTEISAEPPERREGLRGHADHGDGKQVDGQAASRRFAPGCRPSPLKYGTTYTATVTGAGVRRPARQGTSTLHHDGASRSSTIGSGLYLFDDKTYGVAMPVVAEFSPGIPKKDRAAVQKRMFVTTDPPQPGAWHWVSSGTQAYYRAPEYWQPGTTLTVRIALAGHAAEQRPVRRRRPVGDRQDRPVTSR